MDDQAITVRFPRDMFEKIRNRASAHRRSFNREVLVLMDIAVRLEEDSDIETLKRILADRS